MYGSDSFGNLSFNIVKLVKQDDDDKERPLFKRQSEVIEGIEEEKVEVDRRVWRWIVCQKVRRGGGRGRGGMRWVEGVGGGRGGREGKRKWRVGEGGAGGREGEEDMGEYEGETAEGGIDCVCDAQSTTTYTVENSKPLCTAKNNARRKN